MLQLTRLLPLQGAPLLSGVKYILKTELIFERQPTPLTPECALEEEWRAWKRLYAASVVSCLFIRCIELDRTNFHHHVLSSVQARSKEKGGEVFVEAYLAVIDLQKTHNVAASVSSHVNLPPEVLLYLPRW